MRIVFALAALVGVVTLAVFGLVWLFEMVFLADHISAAIRVGLGLVVVGFVGLVVTEFALGVREAVREAVRNRREVR
jgi:hypothetical protein